MQWKSGLRGLTAALLFTLALSGPLAAEPPDNPTLTALEQAEIPYRDRIDLARRLRGLESLPTISPPIAWQMGDTKAFWITNTAENQTLSVEASLRAAGDSIYFWVQSDVTIDPAVLQQLAAIFDEDIYPTVRNLWGSEANPGVDGDPRVYALFAYGMGPSVAAYFSSANSHPQAVVETSNAHEMFFFNLDTLGTNFNVDTLAGTLAHEFQHMIRQNQDPNEVTWMDEGFSTFTELYTGYSLNNLGQVYSYLGRPQTQLNTWSKDGPRLPHYGAAMLFITYFYERYGEDALRALSADPTDGMESFDNILRQLGEPGADVLFADWVLANYLLDPTLAGGQYGYRLLDGLSSPLPEEVISTYPYQRSDIANQYSADYLVLTNLADRTQLDIEIVFPETVSLVPAEAYSGRWMWYSNRHDESDTTLTRAFDLREVGSATLNYRVWYDLEDLWDYGYVMVSTDDGATWTPLETPLTTTENPHDNAYGPAYTGVSSGWQAESVLLDAYAGQSILVRFEVITDDAVNQPGLLIDDVSIPELGYASDFESDDGGWLAAGWVRIDNVLPQQAWVQAVQQTRDGAQISRWLAPDESSWSLSLAEDVDQVLLVISPFAPLTTVPMPYELTVTAQR